jgi:hypothetical protein
MGEFLLFKDYRNQDQFRIDYPYYGLFGSANITRVHTNGDLIYRCQLLNGHIVILKKNTPDKKWIDTELDTPTPLSMVIGLAIDDFLSTSNPRE